MGAGKTVEQWDAWTDDLKSRHGNGNGHGKSLAIEAKRLALLPTPRSTDGPKGGPNQTGDSLQPFLRELDGWWGEYEPAIRRHEDVFGRPAPPPVDEKKRLSPAFVEWMMGWPEGWVDLDGLSRANRLKILGNGVVPQQAAAAYGQLLARASSEEVAA